MHRDGYGFVIPNAGQRSTLQGDIYVNPQAIGSAMHGDQVLVELGASGATMAVPRGASCECSHVVIPPWSAHLSQRFPPQLCDAHGRKGHPRDHHPARDGVARPRTKEKPRGKPPTIPELRTPPAKQSTTRRERQTDADRVLGGEARRREWNDLEGLVVDVEITDWPSPAENPRGRVIEILGYQDDFGVDVEIIIRKFHLPHRFPVEVLQEAQQLEPIIPLR